MGGARLKTIFAKLSKPNQILVLVDLAHELTISARAGSSEPSIAKEELLKAFNELQHKITGQLAKLVANDKARYPDDVFLNSLFHFANSEAIDLPLEEAFKRALSFQKVVSSGSLDDK